MTNGRIVSVILLAAAAAAGVGLWYSMTRAYYTPVAAQAEVQVTGPDGIAAPLPVTGFDGIETVSSPLGFRACFTLAAPLGEAVPYAGATPLVAPGWFDCFDAGELDAALALGQARAVLGTKNIAHGVDRILAVFPDGRGFAWHQLNNCGRKAYDGSPVGEDCPPRPESQ